MIQATRGICGRSFRQTGGPASAFALILALSFSPVVASAADGPVTVEKPWMRFIIKAHPAAGYFTLHNNGNTLMKLTGASSSACGMLMMHQSKDENGVDKMLPVKSISVPAHDAISFAPGSYHLMCMSPTNAMAIGAHVPVTLRFEDGASITASFPVKGPGGK